MPNKIIKNLRDRKNSIFVKILIPTIGVMLLQVVLISLVLIFNGTVGSLDDSATESLYRNAENRSITLENMMVHTWSNIDNLELEITGAVSRYMQEHELRQDEVFGVSSNEKALLSEVSDALIYTIRTTATTGAYVFFIDDEDVESESASLIGLYYRDFNPMMNPTDYSDIQLEKGPATIAQTNGISLSALWSELYTVRSEHTATWSALFEPYKAALKYPNLATSDLALWSDAHYNEPASKNDSNACVKYTRPLFYEGGLIGVIGVEIQVEYLKKYFPSNDIGETGGYALLRYDSESGESGALRCLANTVTGGYIKRLVDSGVTLELTPGNDENIYKALTEHFEPATIAVQTIKLYNSNAPFSDRQWALAAMQPDSVLYTNSANIRSGIMSSSAVSLLLGFLLILIAIRVTTRPLLSIATQIETGDNDAPVDIGNSNTYEISLLRDTINEMKRKRREVEIALREEGERYLLALESAIDIFIEYDIVKDSLKIYFFAEREQGQNTHIARKADSGNHFFAGQEDERKQELTSWTIEGFRANLGENGICHPADVRGFMAKLNGERTEPYEMRLRAALFPHITDSPSDNGYYWFSFTTVPIRAEDGTTEKTIGSAKQITDEKLSELARIEASRRDVTTSAYNAEYGRLIITGQTDEVVVKGADGCLLAMVVGNFEKVEAYYGRIFSAAILREISHGILSSVPGVSRLIRWRNAEFVAFCAESEIAAFTENLRRIYDGTYIGENEEIEIAINVGISKGHRGDINAEESVEQALAAAYSGGNAGVSVVYAGEQTVLTPSVLQAREQARSHAQSQSTGSYSDIGVEISSESVVGFVLSLFEQADDIESIMNMLLRILGGLFTLDRIIICEYDEDFGSSQLAYQWVSDGTERYPGETERVKHTDFVEFESRLNERGILTYDSTTTADFSDGLKRILCIREDEKFSALCCEMYENGLHTGRAIFVSLDEGYKPTEGDALSIYEMTKIISTRLNLEKSNSANRAKSEFLSKMSHEIRTPMNAIIGLTRIAKDSVNDAGQVRTTLDKIDLSAKHLLSLINDILDMSRIESGKLTIEKHPFSLTTLVTGIDTLMRPQFEEKDIDFTITASIERAYVAGDEQKVRQILINLLGNASKFTPSGGAVEFRITQELEAAGMSKCLFVVKDNGVGITEEDQARIFNAFEQSAASNLEAGNPRGTGLGLAISNNFISAMGSRIELESESGVGSEFYFTLELELAEDPTVTSAVSAEDGADITAMYKGKRALLVDDNEINLEIAAYLIEDIGFVCECARDGQEAVDKFLESEPGYYSVIFMDISMPVMDGFAATREIRKRVERSDSRDIPIIAMTANAFTEDTKKSIDAGMNAHVAKPIDVDFLYQTLETIFASTAQQ